MLPGQGEKKSISPIFLILFWKHWLQHLQNNTTQYLFPLRALFPSSNQPNKREGKKNEKEGGDKYLNAKKEKKDKKNKNQLSQCLHTNIQNTQQWIANTPNPQFDPKQTKLIMASIDSGTCSRLWYPICINGHQPQLRTVKPLQVWQKCFSKHNIYIHQTKNNSLYHPAPTKQIQKSEDYRNRFWGKRKPQEKHAQNMVHLRDQLIIMSFIRLLTVIPNSIVANYCDFGISRDFILYLNNNKFLG